MSSYTVITGDTFDLISRKVYGEESQAQRIQRANPGVVEPLAPGTTIITPPALGRPEVDPLSAENPEEIDLRLNNQSFKFWESVTIRRAIDTPDSIGFSAPFDPTSPEFRATIKPFSYTPIKVVLGDQRLFNGTLMGVDPVVSAARKSVNLSGYSRPGVVFDCTAHASAFPLEFDGQTLKQIAVALCAPFGIDVVEIGTGGPKFDRVALKPGKKIGEFLADLAKQRGQVISSTVLGELLIWRSAAPGNQIAILEEGASPVVSVAPTFNPQAYYSSITALSPVSLTSDGEQYTGKNNSLAGVTRPFTFESKDTEVGGVKAAALAKLGRMFGAAAGYTVEVPTWRTPDGELYRRNKTIKLTAPSAMIYNQYEFLIKAITYRRVKDRETASLELVFPGAYSGEQPETLPWD